MKTDRQPPAHFNSRWRFNLSMAQRMLFAGIIGAFLHAKAYADQVDLMVVYTPAVTAIHNGHDGVMAYITSMVSGANQAYTDSGIDQVLHLVHASEINYVEASNRNADLDNLTYSSDGHMDDVHALRDAWGADLVCLLQNSSGGVAWLLSNTNGTPSHGFSVVGTYGAAAGAVLPHELGHNMGGHHDWDNLKGITGLYEDSYGHRFTGEDGVLYRTIMAYPDGQRIFRFSNPALSYAGVPTGIALPEAKAANNARTIGLTSPVVSDYREEVPQEPAFIEEPSDLKAISGSSVTLQALARGSPPLSIQWYEGPSGDTSHPVYGTNGQGLGLTVTPGVRSFWARAYNGHSHVDSRAATVTGIEAWPKSVTADQSQTDYASYWYHQIGQRYWQEFVPSMPYLHSVSLYLLEKGAPTSFRFRILNHQDLPIMEKTIPFSGDIENSIDVGLWVVPGQTYRIECDPGSDTSNYVAWLYYGSADIYPAGQSSYTYLGQPNDFAFQTHGGINTTPVMVAPSNVTIQAGQTLQITVQANDADGDPLDFRASGEAN